MWWWKPSSGQEETCAQVAKQHYEWVFMYIHVVHVYMYHMYGVCTVHVHVLCMIRNSWYTIYMYVYVYMYIHVGV